jgi:hypothetical protein
MVEMVVVIVVSPCSHASQTSIQTATSQLLDNGLRHKRSNSLDMTIEMLWMLLLKIEEPGGLPGGVVVDVPGSKKWDPPTGLTKVGMSPAPGAPLTLGSLALRLIAEELEKPADGEMVEGGIVIGGNVTLEVKLELAAIVEGETVLLGGCVNKITDWRRRDISAAKFPPQVSEESPGQGILQSLSGYCVRPAVASSDVPQ